MCVGGGGVVGLAVLLYDAIVVVCIAVWVCVFASASVWLYVCL